MSGRLISLTQGLWAVVDEADVAQIAQHVWQATRVKNGWYASRYEPGVRKPILMHRQILGLLPGRAPEVDHLNLDGLDNRRINLRTATHSQNLFNHPRRSNNTSGYKGVSYRKDSGKWIAGIMVGGRAIRLGQYADAVTAARAYDAAARRLHGDFARLNFANQLPPPEFLEMIPRKLFHIEQDNLTDQRFGRLLVIGRSGGKWQCLCDCGKTKILSRHQLISSTHTTYKSCGCAWVGNTR